MIVFIQNYLGKQFGGEPFPRKRPDNKYCYAACSLPCCDESLDQNNRQLEMCPSLCRPKNHEDWIYC